MERAVEVYATALREPQVSKSRWFQDVAGDRVARAAAALVPEAVRAAEARGRAWNPEALVGELLAGLEG